MRRYLFAAAAAAVLSVGFAGAANAQVTFAGDYVTATLNTVGSLASLKHDPDGNGMPGVNDYITPGTPHDGFSINSAQTGFRFNDNAGGSWFGSAAVTDVSAGSGFDFAATWTASNGTIEVTNFYFWNNDDERINVRTTLTALSDLDDLAFARSVDPDPDVNTSGSFVTNNQRGNLNFDPEDFVGSAGPVTGLTLGLLNLSGDLYEHNTAIDNFCCANVDPYAVLTGYNDGAVGDYALNLAWRIGDLGAGESAVLNYAYVVGDNIGTVGGGPIPEPATWVMMIMGFGGIGAIVRRRRYAFA